MKFPTAYYLLLLYFTVVLKPVIPMITDAVSHTFANAVHMDTVHAKYGNNHLESELAAAGENDNNKDQNSLKVQDQVPVHFAEDQKNLVFSVKESSGAYPDTKVDNFPSVFLSKHLPPPKFS